MHNLKLNYNGIEIPFKPAEYRKRDTQTMEPWTPMTDMEGVSVSDADKANGSPQHGDMIASSKTDPNDRWLVSGEYFAENYIPAGD